MHIFISEKQMCLFSARPRLTGFLETISICWLSRTQMRDTQCCDVRKLNFIVVVPRHLTRPKCIILSNIHFSLCEALKKYTQPTGTFYCVRALWSSEPHQNTMRSWWWRAAAHQTDEQQKQDRQYECIYIPSNQLELAIKNVNNRTIYTYYIHIYSYVCFYL